MVIILCVIGIVLLSCVRHKADSEQWTSFRQIQSNFENPPDHFHPSTHWIWNDLITRTEIDFQLDEFKHKSLYGLILHSDDHIQPPLYSKDWQNLILYTKVQADSLGMKIWLNDQVDFSRIDELAEADVRSIQTGVKITNESNQTYLIREAASQANQLGHNQVIGEFYSDMDLGLSFQTMKVVGDQAFAEGINSMQFCQSLYSIQGSDQQHGPSFSYHAPWWELFSGVSDYFARLSMVLSTGKPIRNVLVLYPETSIQATASAKPDHPEIHPPLLSFIDTLSLSQVDFDLGDESVLLEYGKIENDVVKVGQAEYSSIIIVPGKTDFKLSTVKFIEKYLKSGGSVAYYNTSQLHEENTFSTVCQTWSQKYNSKFEKIQSVQDLKILKNIHPVHLRISSSDSTQNQLIQLRRQLIDGQLLFLVNTSKIESIDGTVHVPGDAVYILDAFQGDIQRYPCLTQDNQMMFDYSLPPFGSLLFFCATCDTFGIHNSIVPLLESTETLCQVSQSSIAPTYFNSVVLDGCDVSVGEKTYHGLPVHEIDEICEGQSCQIHFPFSIHKQVDRSSFMAVIQAFNNETVYVNAKPVEPMEDAWLLDRGYGVYEIGSHVIAGNNQLTLSKVIDLPVTLFGAFSLTAMKNSWKINPIRSLDFGSWKDQGMPFYSDAVSYIQTYEINKASFRYQVKLNHWQGTVAEVRINDFPAGMIAWPPYSIEVTEHLQEGVNYIEVIVYGSQKNIFANHDSSHQASIHNPELFESYGLFDEFKLVRLEQAESQ
ncbi:glycosyl hydrolase [bacterium]